MALFGSRLRHLRLRRQVQSQVLASRMGVALETISRLEHGKRGSRPTADIARRASDALDVPSYYFTAGTPQEYMQRRVRELAPEDRAQLTSVGERMGWSVDHLLDLFPPGEFSQQWLLARLGIDEAALGSYVAGEITPTPAFLQAFEEATGAPMDFLIAGAVLDPATSSYGEAIRLAQELGFTPSELVELMQRTARTRDQIK